TCRLGIRRARPELHRSGAHAADQLQSRALRHGARGSDDSTGLSQADRSEAELHSADGTLRIRILQLLRPFLVAGESAGTVEGTGTYRFSECTGYLRITLLEIWGDERRRKAGYPVGTEGLHI